MIYWPILRTIDSQFELWTWSLKIPQVGVIEMWFTLAVMSNTCLKEIDTHLISFEINCWWVLTILSLNQDVLGSEMNGWSLCTSFEGRTGKTGSYLREYDVVENWRMKILFHCWALAKARYLLYTSLVTSNENFGTRHWTNWIFYMWFRFLSFEEGRRYDKRGTSLTNRLHSKHKLLSIYIQYISAMFHHK